MMETEDRKRRKGGAFPAGHACAAPGCDQPGDYRAPGHPPTAAPAASPDAGPQPWQYLCLEHVRAFNAGWNYFAGMSPDEKWETEARYPHWDRATRAFAHNAFAGGPDRVADTLGVLRWKSDQRLRPALSAADRRALKILGLPETATLAEVKTTFRRLARHTHPDANAGSRAHETRFQQLSEAASHLQQSASFRQTAAP